MAKSKYNRFWLQVLIGWLVLISLACSLPTLQRPTPSAAPVQLLFTQESQPAQPTTTSTVEPLPPALVESNPPPGSIIGMDAPITLIFNQPMERTSVEASLSIIPNLGGKFSWGDDRTLTFTTDAPLLPNTRLELKLSTTARSQAGLTLRKPVSLAYTTAGYLQIAQKLPAPGAVNVDPESAIAVTFNQPVVPLGADESSLAPAFLIEPEVQGRGTWLNTSTYLFYPKPSLDGGTTYTVRLDPTLKSADGGPLLTPEEWMFTTAIPRLEKIEPEDGSTGVRLDAVVRLIFNQRMDIKSVEASFSLLDSNLQPVEGSFSWNENHKECTFTPASLLQRDSQYTVVFSDQVLNAGGSPLVMPVSIRWKTEPALSVYPINPLPQGSQSIYEGIQLGLSASLAEQDLFPYLTFLPPVPNLNYWVDSEKKTLTLFGDFTASTSYVLVVSENLPDAWGGRLGQPFLLPFRTEPLPPTLVFSSNSPVQFLTPEDSSLPAQAANLLGLYLFRSNLPLADFIQLTGAQGTTYQEIYQPENEVSWFTTLYASPQRVQSVEIPLSADKTPLEPGLYYLRFDPSALPYAPPLILVISQIHLTLKLSPTDALIWAVDLRSNTPVAGLSVSVFDDTGKPLTTGLTGADGVFHSPISPLSDPYRTYYAIAEQPGDEMFGLTLLNWSEGVTPDVFDIPFSFQIPGTKTYLYTDRPIYRPGQTVYFRAVSRQMRNGTYSLPTQTTLPVSLYNSAGALLKTFELPLSAYGTAHGEYILIPEAPPGYYRLESGEASLYFQVAAYRKPEIDLKIEWMHTPLQLGDELRAEVQARYYFGVPAGDIKLNWTLYQNPEIFPLPGYQTGPEQFDWLEINPFLTMGFPPGTPVAQGSGRTNPDGTFSIEHLTRLEDDLSEKAAGLRNYVLEVTLEDESGQPVSTRASILIHPAPIYIGVRPDAWTVQAGSEIGFDVQTVDWNKEPAGNQTLRGEFRKVTWIRQEAPTPGSSPAFIPQYTPISSVDFITSAEGQARLAFIPPEPGNYQLEIRGEGAVTQATLWVGGSGQVNWPNLPNQRLRLTADQMVYRPGQEARIFIPNPFGKELDALITIERNSLLRHQVIHLEASGSLYTLPLDSKDAPNVYVTALLLGRDSGGHPDFRLGVIELAIEAVEQILNVSLVSDPNPSAPGEKASFKVRVTDHTGKPVQGEFSLALVDKAVLALAEDNAPTIQDAFYGQEPLYVRTGLALAGYARRITYGAGELGGGGEMVVQTVREKFPDTAYWNAEIVTDANGEALIEVTLPDSLTTWQADLRGLTADTRVGQAVAQVVVTKELIIRPVTPRFLTAGDHVLLAAVIHNNTASELQAEAILQAKGLILDESLETGAPASRRVTLPAWDRTRVEWWGTVQDVSSVDLVFSVQAGDLQDAARPALGVLPVLRYTAPQAFATAGLLEQAGQEIELVNLPSSYSPTHAGELRLELAPSLVASMQSALNVLEILPYACTEQILARFLPNLEIYQALQTLNLNAPEMRARLERTLGEGLNTLQARQNPDGGWSWWPGEASDPFMTAYVLFGLQRAQNAGINLNPNTLQRGADYLIASLPTPEMTPEGWRLDRLAFAQFALAQVGMGDLGGTMTLYTVRERLSPWAQALLALTLYQLNPEGLESQILLSELQATAARMGTGAFWEDRNGGWSNMSTPISTTAMVVYALSRREPASALLPEATRYLMANRNPAGTWSSTFETAWALMALTEFFKGTGELGGNFSFQAAINGVPLASGQSGGDAWLNVVRAVIPASQLNLDAPNALTIQRTEGSGRLYYRAVLDVALPVEAIAPLNRGLTVSRTYYPLSPECQRTTCAPVQGIPVNQQVLASVTLVLPQDAYYILLEDYIPAGTEILDASLKTTPLGSLMEIEMPEGGTSQLYEAEYPFAEGWGWWLFNAPQIFDDHITWTADFLPAGTYTLQYALNALQPGEYRVLPAQARLFYFAEVQGSSAGMTFTITP